MKLFGWGMSKAPQPQTVLQQVKKTDPRNSNHGQDRGMHTLPCKSSNVRKQQGLFDVDDDDQYLPSAKAAAKSSSGGTPNQSNDEKLQDTIRFVFSLEQEGLLAIGTFALEQLAAIRDTRNHQKQFSDGFESCTDCDDEDHLPRLVKSTCEFPSDIYSSGDESDDEERLKQAAKPDSKALSLYTGNRSPVAGTKPIVLLNALPPELRKTLDPASPWLHREPLPYVPLGHWTDTAPPVVVLPKANVDQDYYSSYFCGLFSSKKPSSRSEKAKRSSTQKKIAEDYKKFSTKPADQNTKKSLLNFGSTRVPSLEKLAKLWRSSCLQSSARIAPERKSCSPRVSQVSKGAASNEITSGDVLTTPVTLSLGPCDNKMRPPGRFFSEDFSPKVAEFRRRVAMHERNMGNAAEERGDGENDGGHWIKDDSECKLAKVSVLSNFNSADLGMMWNHAADVGV